ncbi:MAG: hypothetical protein GJU72_14795 [Acidithiobacillus ferriphilus]|jgi:hypothetical protein|uniref:hypothetical protein n=1 Tax=Acidithiobacillus ferriphilus TaxID=1689834 RepID=UPI00242BD7C1|nr:hypothetical protein [Acidithiobacillus ferriphilus]MBW9250285.1 hypothetical protein [Acidithiobacillus ferriphilus]MBW9254344.1 hypothetical protein [Acidithiobacillus ferriphilus]
MTSHQYDAFDVYRLIHVDGGLIQSVFADGEAVAADITVAIVDYDVARDDVRYAKGPLW